MAATIHPVRVDASLDAPLSRGLWLVKWAMVIPHGIVLVFLWVAFALLSAVAFFAILFTGRYPRAIFDFNVGVLRWTWRVQYYAYGALGTDRYPPFTLAEVPGYPAHLEIAYPERLSRGLVLVKWLLGLPHYLIVALFAGGGTWLAWRAEEFHAETSGGLVGLLVLVAALVLLFTGRYPRPIYDFVLGMNRWILRVAAYGALMTDAYPPFRLDMGEHEPGDTLTLPPSSGPGVPPSSGPGAPRLSGPGAPAGPATGGPAVPDRRPDAAAPRKTGGAGWTAGRVVSVVAGALLVLASAGPLLAAAALAWAVPDQGSAAGYLTSGARTFTTNGYALVSEPVEVHVGTFFQPYAADLAGGVRLQAEAVRPGAEVFLGVAPAAEVDRYLAGVARTTVADVSGGWDMTIDSGGGAPALPPAAAGIWTVQAAGAGEQTVTWPAGNGEWKIVVMNADGSAAPGATLRVAVDAPAAPVTAALAAGGAVVLLAGALLVAVPVRRVSR
ncbi:DUF4389 domain-containing protein [Planomonospora corallina]|uniref:DUF4389 domain-containing protein n=1 Tax=Planomonospora corallina TaxID=1806052 RepID=A0ABV8IDM8_9ACTN